MPKAVYKMVQDAAGYWRAVNIEDLPAPEARIHVIDDTIDPLEHPCDGRFYTSKRRFSDVTRAHGCIEVGERPGDRRERSIDFRARRDELQRVISRAYDDLEAGRGPKWPRVEKWQKE